MISKIIPPESRGTFFGMQAGLANLFISGSAIAAGYLLDTFASPWDFAVCFFIASIFFTLIMVRPRATNEPEDTEKIIPEEKTHFWDDAKRVLSRDKNFNWFLVARILSQFATMGFSFYIIYALRRIRHDGGRCRLPHRHTHHLANRCQHRHGLDRRPHRPSRHAHHSAHSPLAQRRAGMERNIHSHGSIPSFFSRAGKRLHLDHRHDHDRRLRHRSLNVPSTSGSRKHSPPRHHHRPHHRRLDRGLGRLHPHIHHLTLFYRW
jgi:hypothetical protein